MSSICRMAGFQSISELALSVDDDAAEDQREDQTCNADIQDEVGVGESIHHEAAGGYARDRHRVGSLLVLGDGELHRHGLTAFQRNPLAGFLEDFG